MTMKITGDHTCGFDRCAACAADLAALERVADAARAYVATAESDNDYHSTMARISAELHAALEAVGR